MLAADVPYLEVDGRIRGWEFDGCDVLADGGYGFEVWVRGRVRGLICSRRVVLPALSRPRRRTEYSGGWV
jgi:hypothetical protein